VQQTRDASRVVRNQGARSSETRRPLAVAIRPATNVRVDQVDRSETQRTQPRFDAREQHKIGALERVPQLVSLEISGGERRARDPFADFGRPLRLFRLFRIDRGQWRSAS
jgi:hypothetical protein